MSVSAAAMSAYATLQRNFAAYDTAAEGGEADGKISRADLETVAENADGRYTLEQELAAEYLLQHPECFWQADVAGQETLVADGIVSDDDIALVVGGAQAPAAPAEIFADPYSGTMQTLALDFDVFDGAGDGGTLDGRVGFGDLIAIAYDNTGRYTPQQQAAARYLLDHVELFNSLDIASEGYGADGLISRDDLAAAATWPPPAASGGVPSFDTNGDGVLDPAEEHAAIVGLAPVLYADPDDGYLMTDPEQFIAGATFTTPDGTPVPDPVAYLQQNPDAVLVIDAGETANASPDATITYVSYDAATRSITYFFFYPNNDGPQGGSGIGDRQDHEGDWERVTVQLDESFRPTMVYYSSHSGSSSMAWSQVIKEDGRPVVFVAAGSHANYFLPGSYGTEFPTADDITVSDPSAGLRFDSQDTTLADIRDQWWYAEGDRIHWGEQREHSLTVPRWNLRPTELFPGVTVIPMVGLGEVTSEEWNRATSGPRGPNPDKDTLAPDPPATDVPNDRPGPRPD